MSTIKIRIKPLEDASLIRILIAHPMDTGRVKDPVTGEPIPAHFIEEVKISHNGKLVAQCKFGTSVSRDPYLSFRLKGGKSGDRIQVRWTDNLGQSDSEEIALP